MGNDGAEAITHLKEHSLTVWAQSSETCASAAMPDASRETGAVSYSGFAATDGRKACTNSPSATRIEQSGSITCSN